MPRALLPGRRAGHAWRDKRGSLAALEPWRPFPETVVAALVPEEFDPERLGKVLFPDPGRYRLESEQLMGPRGVVALEGLVGPVTECLECLRLPHRLRMTAHGKVWHFTPAPTGQRLSLSHGALEESGADVVAYGAKDTGEMGGGAAARSSWPAGKPSRPPRARNWRSARARWGWSS